ncbi:hypothetical protein VNO80_13316 [Phaseolus coccineus]|uniref:Uncharacterized protein n=1 Tax=Phaseolus coccineus TaxID=3886 RepID=A0AAN9RB63_PHACN
MPSVDVAPASVPVQPMVIRKRGRLPKVQASVEVGSSSTVCSSMLSPYLPMAQAMQFSLSPEEESILAAAPTNDLIKELVDLQCRDTVVGKTLGEELTRTSVILVPKLKIELAELAKSLQEALATVEACREKMRPDELAAQESLNRRASILLPPSRFLPSLLMLSRSGVPAIVLRRSKMAHGVSIKAVLVTKNPTYVEYRENIG